MMRSPACRAAALLVTLALPLVADAAPAELPLTILHRIPIGGEGGWDLLAADGAAHRLYLSHGNRVVVVDTRADSAVGEIPDTPGVHGIALAPGLSRGFTSNGRDSSVTIFDTRTLATIAVVKVPARNPDAIGFDPATRRVFVMNGGSANVTALDAASGEVVGTVAVGGKPELAVSDGAGRMFVNLEDSSAVAVLDARALRVVARWPLAPGEEPTGLAIDVAHHRLFAACGNKTLVVLDARDGHVVATVPIGGGVDGDAFDARRGLVYTSNGEGTLSVIHEDSPDRYRVVQTLATDRGARTIALDDVTGTVWLPTADFGPPPAPTPERPHPRPSLVPGSFRVLAIGR